MFVPSHPSSPNTRSVISLITLLHPLLPHPCRYYVNYDICLANRDAFALVSCLNAGGAKFSSGMCQVPASGGAFEVSETHLALKIRTISVRTGDTLETLSQTSKGSINGLINGGTFLNYMPECPLINGNGQEEKVEFPSEFKLLFCRFITDRNFGRGKFQTKHIIKIPRKHIMYVF